MGLFDQFFRKKSTPEKPDNTTRVRDPLDILTAAISDVGYWRWWAGEYPDYFQIEFGGTQLYFPSANSDEAPQTVMAIRFIQPVSVSFIIRGKEKDFEWAQLLHEDNLEPPTCTYGDFAFIDATHTISLLELASEIKTVHGYNPASNEFITEPYHLIFWCGDVGLAIAAKGIEIVNYEGLTPLNEIGYHYSKWWEYWKTYWDKKDTDNALPFDYACEVTIPLKN